MTEQLLRSIAISISLLCMYGISYYSLLTLKGDAKRNISTHQETQLRGIWDLPPLVLNMISGEFKGLVADYLTLEAGAQLGTEVKRVDDGNETKYVKVKKKIDWLGVQKIFTASQLLDPSFAQTYIVAQGWLPWDAGMIDETNVILQRSAQGRPWDWMPTQLRGFNTYFFLNDFGKAGKIYLQAAKVPGAPNYLAILGTRLAQEGGESAAAIDVVRIMLDAMAVEEPGYNELTDRLHALEGVLILEKAVHSYRSSYGSFPKTLDELISVQLLTKIPENPYGVDYCIDNKGLVYFDNPLCREDSGVF